MPSADAALAVARVGEGAYVTAQVGAAVTAAIKASPGLATQLARFPTPELVYKLGDPLEAAPGVWRIPFTAYAVPRVP